MKRYLPIGAILLLAAVLRLHGLGAQSLWFDEALTLWLCRLPYRELIQNLKFFDQTPPLNHVVTGWFVALFGDSEAVLRLPSALAGIASVAAIYAVGRRMGSEKLALLSGLLLATNPYAIYYAQEARGYSMELCLSLLSTHAFLIMLKSFPRGRVYYISMTALLLYAHPYGGIVPLCHAIAWAHARRRSETRIGFAQLALAFAMIGLLYLPWAPMLWLGMKLTGSGFWIPPLHWDDVSAAYWIYCNTAAALIAVTVSAVVGGAMARRRSEGLLVMLLATLPVLIPIAASIVLHRAMFTPRYGIAALGGVCLLAGTALDAMPVGAATAAAVMFVVAMRMGAGPAPDSPGFTREKQPWREIGRDLRERMQPNSLVLYSPGFTKIHFDYYVRRPDARQVPFQANQAYPPIEENHFWLIVSLARRPTYEFLNSGQWRVVSSRIYGDMMVLELQHV